MTEQEYINLSDKVRLDIALKALGEIIPESSSVIPNEEFLKIRSKLWNIRDSILKYIKIEELDEKE